MPLADKLYYNCRKTQFCKPCRQCTRLGIKNKNVLQFLAVDHFLKSNITMWSKFIVTLFYLFSILYCKGEFISRDFSYLKIPTKNNEMLILEFIHHSIKHFFRIEYSLSALATYWSFEWWVCRQKGKKFIYHKVIDTSYTEILFN